MKIAFDVKGTIDGMRQKDVLKMFHTLQAMGHEMFVWSNSFQYAIDAVEKFKLKAIPLEKYARWDARTYDKDFMDLAVEDDYSQTWLAAHHIVLVHQIPQDLGCSFARGLVKDLTLYKNSSEE